MTAKRKARARRTPAAPPRADFLDTLTGHDRAWWFARVQDAVVRVGKHRGSSRVRSDLDVWTMLQEIAADVSNTLPPSGAYDPNMRGALVLSYVLALWYFRLHRAKCWHPARPLEGRRAAYAQWLGAVREFSMLWVDERDDHTFMPQQWDNPFLPGAKSGKFR